MSDTWFEDVGLAESPFATEVEAPAEAWPSETAGLPASWPETEEDGVRGGLPFATEAWTPWAPAESWSPEGEEVPFGEAEEQAPGAALSASRLEWPGAPAGGLRFMRAVYDKHVELSRAKGGTFVADLPRIKLDDLEGTHKARKGAAAAARGLLAEAKAALAAAGLAGRERIGVVSGYRPASRQFDIWQGKGRKGTGGFPFYYQQLLKQGRLRPGDYGPAAVAAMAAKMAECIAAPGYSNHQDGLAIDFGAGAVGGDRLRFITPDGNGKWFHNWLVANAARHRFEPYPKEPWHWIYRPPELIVDRVPLLADHRGRGPDLILGWNVFSVPEEIDVVVHLHGNTRPGMRLDDDIQPVSGLDLTPVGVATWQGRSRPTLTVLPRGKDTGVKQKGSNQYRYSFPSLVSKTKNSVPDLVRFSLERFAAELGGTAPRVGRLILTAHSAGGKALLQILEHQNRSRDRAHDPHQVHVFDALYQDAAELVKWAERHIDQDRKALAALGATAAREYMTTRGGALRVFYLRVRDPKDPDLTRVNSRKLYRKIAPKLDPGLEPWYRVELSSYGHFKIPMEYGWHVLADASANVPDASTEPVTQPATQPEVGLEPFYAWEKPEWTATEDLEEEDLEEEDLEEEEELEEGDLEGFLTQASEEALDEESVDSQELFEAEEFAHHALYELSPDEDEIELGLAAEELPGVATRSRPRNLTSAQVRTAWSAYRGAKHRMVPLRLFGTWNPPVNPHTVDAWRALERALAATGYDVHRAWVFEDRTIAGKPTKSLHAYGLAIDIDHSKPKCNVNRATKNRRKVRFSSAATKEERCRDVRKGKADTSFTPDQVAAVEAIRTVDGHQVFVWGGRWHNTKDTMHFEINVTPDELARGLQPDPGDRLQLADPAGELEEEAEGFLTHASEEALDRLEPLDDEAESPGSDEETQAGQGLLGRVLEHSVLVAAIAAGERSEKALTDKIFRLRYPDPKATGIAKDQEALKLGWRQIRDRQVLPLLLTGPSIGPMHDPLATTPIDPKLRKGVPKDAVLSPLSITRRGLRKATRKQPDKIAAIVVHNTSRGPANRSRERRFRGPAIDYALDHYLNGKEGYPHYVVDFNGTIYASCDERDVAAHAGWVHAGGRKLFSSGWTAPDWWSRVWSKHGAKTPIDLLPKGARSPNYRTIGIELLLLPDMSYTPQQYKALAQLVVDIQRRNPEVHIPAAPSRGLLGHEDFAPVRGDGGRADAHGGWDPGAHRDRPFFDWQLLWTEIQAVSGGLGAGGKGAEASESWAEFDMEDLFEPEDALLAPDDQELDEESDLEGREDEEETGEEAEDYLDVTTQELAEPELGEVEDFLGAPLEAQPGNARSGPAAASFPSGETLPVVSGPDAVTDHLGGRLWTFRADKPATRVAVFCPRAALGRHDVDVLLFAHGLLRCRGPRRIPAGFITDKPFGLGRVVATSGRPVVLVVPALNWDNPGGERVFGKQHARWHALGDPQALNALLAQALTDVGRVQGTTAPTLQNLIIAGHSRAHSLLEPLAHRRRDPAMSQGALSRLRRIVAFDTTYRGDVNAWVDWLRLNPQLQVDVFYRRGSLTAAVGDKFYRCRRARLNVTPVNPVKEEHCDVPARRLPEVLGVGLGADEQLPDDIMDDLPDDVTDLPDDISEDFPDDAIEEAPVDVTLTEDTDPDSYSEAAKGSWTASDATREYALTEDDIKLLASQTSEQRAKDRAEFDKKAEARLGVLEKAKKKGMLDGGEEKELAHLQELKTRIKTTQRALKRKDVEEVLEKAGHTVAEWFGDIQEGTFLNIPLRVHRALAARLTQAQAALVNHPTVNRARLNAAELGRTLGMYDSTSDLREPKAAVGGTSLSLHTFGLAVDLNITGNPFLGHASRLAPAVVRRATSLVNGTAIDVMAEMPKPEVAYATLKTASRALTTYFSYRDPAKLAELTAKVTGHTPARGEPTDVPTWLKQIEKDHADLSAGGDFKRHNPPDKGFLDFKEAVVLALTRAGLRWGGTYGGPKDIMHFDLRQAEGAKVNAARRAHTANK